MGLDAVCHCGLLGFLALKSFHPSTVRQLSDSCMFLSLSKTETLVGVVRKPKARNSEAQLKPLTLVPPVSHLIPCDLAPALFYQLASDLALGFII